MLKQVFSLLLFVQLGSQNGFCDVTGGMTRQEILSKCVAHLEGDKITEQEVGIYRIHPSLGLGAIVKTGVVLADYTNTRGHVLIIKPLSNTNLNALGSSSGVDLDPNHLIHLQIPNESYGSYEKSQKLGTVQVSFFKTLKVQSAEHITLGSVLRINQSYFAVFKKDGEGKNTGGHASDYFLVEFNGFPKDGDPIIPNTLHKLSINLSGLITLDDVLILEPVIAVGRAVVGVGSREKGGKKNAFQVSRGVFIRWDEPPANYTDWNVRISGFKPVGSR